MTKEIKREDKACMSDEHKPRAGRHKPLVIHRPFIVQTFSRLAKERGWATGGKRSDAARSCVPRPASLIDKSGGATSSGSARIEGVGILLGRIGVGMNRTSLLYRAALSLRVDVKVEADSNR